jgi:Lrp/AsnC family leucine-responsive transcriptional regulator
LNYHLFCFGLATHSWEGAVDEIDYRILKELQWDARLSNTELASRVGLSPSPCWTRVRNLEKQGTIERYVTIFNQRLLGLPDTAFVYLTLHHHDDEALHRFEVALAKLSEVVEAYLLTGDTDYFIKVAVAGTESYERFLREKLYKIPGINHSRTSFALRCLKQTFSALPPPD